MWLQLGGCGDLCFGTLGAAICSLASRCSNPNPISSAPTPATHISAPSTRQQQAAYTRHFQRLLQHQGSWEGAGTGHTTAGGTAPCMAPPQEAWEGLGQHALELSEVAASAADVASSLQYFQVCQLAGWWAGVPGWTVFLGGRGVASGWAGSRH